MGFEDATLHARSATDDNSPHWQELTPQLAKPPFQIDLMKGVADRGTREPLGEIAPILAAIYRKVRIRFVSGPMAAGGRLIAKDASGGAPSNCVVTADSLVPPFCSIAPTRKLRITS